MKSTLLSSLVVAALALHAHAYVDVEDGAFNVRHIHMVERGESGETVGRAFGNEYSIIKRDENDLEVRGRCTTVLACGTAGGCATMAGQRYCKGESWNKSFQKAVKQTGANGITGLKMMAEGIGRGPVGMVAGMAKSTAKALIKAKKETKASKAAAKKSNSKKSAKEKKSSSKKSTPKKAAPKKKGGKKAASKKAPSKKASKKSTPKKAAPKKAAAPKKSGKSGKKKRDLEDEELIMNRRDFDVVERDEDMNLVQRAEYSIFDLVSRDEDGSFVTRECEMYNGEVSCM